MGTGRRREAYRYEVATSSITTTATPILIVSAEESSAKFPIKLIPRKATGS
jgi:hypothetical protein